MQFKPSKIRQARYKLERLVAQEQEIITPKQNRHLIEEPPTPPQEGFFKRVFRWMFTKKK
ncbi:MAG: hypothetical protein JXQ76_05045 [Campylobacterales bacterium]|nr:hypothetical protein [Campylobacterales bacterium]